MIDNDLLIKNIFEYLKILFPDFATCRSYYYDTDMDSDDLVKKLTAVAVKRFQNNIDTFDFKKYKNKDNHSELFEYIQTFLPEKYQDTGILIFNTFAQRILLNTHDNEEKFRDNSELFLSMIKTEIDELIALIKHLPKQNDYLFYTNDITTDNELKGRYLTDNILLHSMDKNLVLTMKNMDFNIREYHKIETLLVEALSLIFTEKIQFYQFADTHTLLLKEYGCKYINLYPINDTPWHISQYNIPFIPFKSQINLTLDNFEKIQNLLSQYMILIQNIDKDDYKRVSLDFYLDALTKFGAAKITYSVIAIEALFNVSHADIQKTVIQRGLKILQNFYTPEYWEQIECDLKTAYDIRSEYAHGESKKSKKATIKLSERILEYARIILIVFIQLSLLITNERKKTKEKKYINQHLIEKSLLYPDVNTRFCQMISNLQVHIKPFEDIGDVSNLFPVINQNT